MRQFNLAIAIVATIGLTSAAFAEDEAPQPRQGKADGNFRERLLKEFDADGDGKLNDEEQAKAQAAAKKLRGNAEGAGRPDKAKLMKQFDSDGDGKISVEERLKAREAFIRRNGGAGVPGRPGQDFANREAFVKKFDKDGNGKLDGNELVAAREAMAKLRERGGAGTLPGGSGEARKPRVDKRDLLERFDGDGDGKLDDEERAKAVEEFKKRNK